MVLSFETKASQSRCPLVRLRLLSLSLETEKLVSQISVPYIRVLQNGWATLGPFKNHLMLSQRKWNYFGAEWYEFTLRPCLNDQSIKAYSLLKDVCINYYGSITLIPLAKESLSKRKGIQIQIYVSGLQNVWVTLSPFHVLVFYKMDGRHWVP